MSDDLVRHGYAPGSYCCTCHKCGGQFIGEKRAYCCKCCAISADRIEELEANLSKAVKVLVFYSTISADKNKSPWNVYSKDFGEKARTILSELKGTQP